MSKNISANILPSSILLSDVTAPTTIAGVSVKLNEAKSNILKYNQDLRITDNTVTSLTARKSTLDISLQRNLDDLKLITINLEAEQAKHSSALSLLEIKKSTLATLVDYDTELQDNYYILSNDKYIYLNNIKTMEENIIIFQKAYDASVANKNITLENIKFYEDSIKSNSQGLQLLRESREDCIRKISFAEENIPKKQSKISEFDTANVNLLSEIKKYSEALPTLVRVYGSSDSYYPKDVNRDNFYSSKVVQTKHRTSIFGINAEPYYTSHTEKVFNQAGYDRAVAKTNKERTKINEKKQLISNMTNLKAKYEQSVAHNNKFKGETQEVLKDLINQKQFYNEKKQKLETFEVMRNQEMNQLVSKKQEQIENLKKYESKITEYQECLEDAWVLLQADIEELAIIAGEITRIKPELEKTIVNKQLKTAAVTRESIDVQKYKELVHQYTNQKRTLEESIKIIREETEQTIIQLQTTLQQQEEIKAKIAQTDLEIKSLAAALSSLNDEAEESLVGLSENLSLNDTNANINYTNINTDLHDEVELAGSNLVT